MAGSRSRRSRVSKGWVVGSVMASLVLLRFVPAEAQKAQARTLESILQTSEKNLNEYDARIPSFYCDERVAAQVFPGEKRDNTVTDSIFRLKRTGDASHVNFDESREIKLMNGKPPGPRTQEPPMSLEGAFEGGLAVVSLNQRECMRYTLERFDPKRSQSYVVRFSSEPHPPRPVECLMQEAAKGRVFLDPATMQMTRMELTVPHHMMKDGWRREMAEWTISVDYAPVVLEEQTFWMPATISSSATSGKGTFHAVTWSFQATYRNYHRLEVTHRILPVEPVQR